MKSQTLISILWLVLASPWSASVALEPTTLKLFGRTPTVPQNHFHGTATAISERYALVGEPGHNEVFALDFGAVHVYDAATGAYRRRLTPADAQGGRGFGSSVAVCGDLALVGAPGDDTQGTNSGAAYLFDLRTGRQLRKIFADTAQPGAAFGAKVAMSGDLAAISAPGSDGGAVGSVFVFRLPSGEAVPQFVTSPTTGDRFGHALALSGRLLLVGAPNTSSQGPNAGAAYLYDALTGVELAHWEPEIPDSEGEPTSAGSELLFGAHVAMSGNRALVSAEGDDGIGENAGAVYVFELSNTSMHYVIRPPFPFTDGPFGSALALQGNLALISQGFYVWLYTNNQVVKAFYPPSINIFDGMASVGYFGQSVSIAGNRLLIGAPGDDERADDAGAAYLVGPVSVPLPMDIVAQSGDSASQVPEAIYAQFGNAYLNDNLGPVFNANLTGDGAASGRNRGLWGRFFSSSGISLAFRQRDPLDSLGLTGVRISLLTQTLMNRGDRMLLAASLTGRDVNAFNNRILLARTPNATSQVMRTGGALPGLLGSQVAKINEAVQSGSTSTLGVSYGLRPGVGDVTPVTDSGVIVLNDSNTPQSNSFREGVNVPDVGVLGQFAPRLTQQWWSEGVGFAAAILPQGNASARSGVFAAGLDGIPIPKVLSGQPADGADGSEGGFFRSFLGETFADDREYDPFANDFVNMLRLQVRATVSGSAVSVANNEVLWRSDFGRVARKGQPLHPAVPAVVISRFLGHWAESESPRLIMLVKLAGPGVNATNDLAVVMRMESGDFITLLREGDATEGDDGAHIGTIQRVAMEPRQGGYMILASLTGDPRRNQAVFMGKSNTGNSFARSTLRLPQMRLRKGTLYQRAGGDSITTVRSLTCPLMTDISGAGNKGLGNVLVGHQTIFSVEFENKRRAVVTLPTF